MVKVLVIIVVYITNIVLVTSVFTFVNPNIPFLEWHPIVRVMVLVFSALTTWLCCMVVFEDVKNEKEV